MSKAEVEALVESVSTLVLLHAGNLDSLLFASWIFFFASMLLNTGRHLVAVILPDVH